MREVTSNSIQETINLGKKLATYLEPGDVISLVGELGTGKTVFVKGLAKGLGIKGEITSPTFIILKQFEGRLILNHFDVYRIDSRQFSDLGYRDFFYSDAVSVIEWGDRISKLLPEDTLSVSFKYREKEQTRAISVSYVSRKWVDKTKKWLS